MATTRSNDYAEKETDKYVNLIEKKIQKVYSKASKEMKKKFNSFVERFSKEDSEKLKALEGIDDDDEYVKAEKKYLEWRQQQLFKKDLLSKMTDTLADDLVKADQKVMSIVNGYLPDAYALNYNFATYDIEQNTSLNASFTLYSRESVEKLLEKNSRLLPKKKVDIPKDKMWNKQHLRNEIVQGILQGKSIPDIADRLQNVADMDRRAAVRNARTMMTGAQNGGRMDAYERAANLGVNIQKEWMATLDSRTRDSHAKLDGERVPWKKAFSNGLKYPADPSGDPAEVYNCRCTMVPFYPEYENVIQKRMTYSEWVKQKQQEEKKSGGLSDKLQKELDEMLALKPNMMAAQMYKKGYMTQEDALKAMKDGTIADKVQEIYSQFETGDNDFLSSWTTEKWVDMCKANPPVDEMIKIEELFFNSISEDEKHALERYTGSAYRKMNGYLRDIGAGIKRKNVDSEIIDYIEKCHNALNSHTLDRPLVLRRGTDFGDLAGLFMTGDFDENEERLERMSAEELNKMFQGQVGTYFGFTSTSSQWSLGFSGPVEVMLYAPEGTPASSIMRISQFGTGEGETLLRDNTKVICRKIEESKDRHKNSTVRVFLEIIQDD